MYARVARWEGDKEVLDGMVDEIRKQSEANQGPPEGVPAKGLMLLRSLDGGTSIAIGLFETEDDLKQGDATLNSMSPPAPHEGAVRRVSVDLAEVALELSAD
jgi:hypothetical protein